MGNSIAGRTPVFQFSRRRTVERSLVDQKPYDALAAELQSALAREGALRKEKRDLWRRHVMLEQEFEHRTNNGLQLIADLLSLQSRTTPTPEEARTQLNVAARRVVALGTVNHRLHLSNQPANVEFIDFLVGLCDDLSGLLFQDQTSHTIVVQGTKVEIPWSLAHTLGLITNELITNSVKHATAE